MKKLQLYYTRVNSPIGPLYLIKNGRGIRHITFGKPEFNKLQSKFRQASGINLDRNEALFSSLKTQLEEYFSGKRKSFRLSFDWDGASPFQKKVWREMAKIPYGETRSYQWLAEKVKIKSPRAIGQACGANPLPIVIPCHRVIASDGKLGGFGGGLKVKAILLKLEGAFSQ